MEKGTSSCKHFLATINGQTQPRTHLAARRGADRPRRFSRDAGKHARGYDSGLALSGNRQQTREDTWINWPPAWPEEGQIAL